jgi:hypothetical protein
MAGKAARPRTEAAYATATGTLLRKVYRRMTKATRAELDRLAGERGITRDELTVSAIRESVLAEAHAPSWTAPAVVALRSPSDRRPSTAAADATLQKRLDAAVKTSGCAAGDLFRIGLTRILDELDVTGSIRAGESLHIPSAHHAALVKWAKFLEAEPQTFFGWLMDDAVKEFEEPDGTLGEWVHSLLVYKTKASERRVKARFKKLEFEREGKNRIYDRKKLAKMDAARKAGAQ